MLFGLLMIATGFMQDGGSVSKSDNSVERGEIASILFTGMRVSKEALRSGVFSVNGRFRRPRSGVAEGVEGEVKIFCAFDSDADLFRFDRTEPRPLPSSDRKSEKVYELGTGKYIRTSDHALTWISPSSGQNIEFATAIGYHPTTIKPSGLIAPFDVRCLGLYLWIDLVNGTSFDHVFGVLSRASWFEVARDGKGAYRLRRHLGRRNDVHTLWIDENQGYSVVRSEVSRKALKNAESPASPYMSSEVSWLQSSGAWVPTKFKIESRESSTSQIQVRSYDYTFE
jgi:hypothetical protein